VHFVVVSTGEVDLHLSLNLQVMSCVARYAPSVVLHTDSIL